jgi:hypothetical protein
MSYTHTQNAWTEAISESRMETLQHTRVHHHRLLDSNFRSTSCLHAQSSQ